MLDRLSKSSILKFGLSYAVLWTAPANTLFLNRIFMDPKKTVRMGVDSPDADLGGKPPLDQTVNMHSDRSDEASEMPSAPSFYNLESPGSDVSLESILNQPNTDLQLPYQFGEYELVEKIGSGGAGIVYRAKSGDGGNDVAIKILRSNIVNNEIVLQRFLKESRMHAQIKNPFVARHLGVGQFEDRYFLASEFIEGEQLGALVNSLKEIKNVELVKKLSLLVIRDLLRGLAAMHQRGLIHRDIKPENAIVGWKKSNNNEISLNQYKITKLIDFGLARPVNQGESLAITQQHIVLGTPLYMAPEQFSESRQVDARADVYSMGVTLYQMLAGQPPFLSNDATELAEKHRLERPRPLTRLDRGVGDALNSIVTKAMEKEPGLRYADANEMLADIECVMDGRPISIKKFETYPELSERRAKTYRYQWTLDAPIDQLWSLVADTNRFNQAIGLPAPTFEIDHSESDKKIFAEAKFNGLKVKWREYPFQWVRLRELSVLRVFESGPFKSVTSTVMLAPLADAKTAVTHEFQVIPRGLLGKMITPFQFGFATRRSLNKVYQRLETIARQSDQKFACDLPFGKPIRLTSRQSRVLENRTDELMTRFSQPQLVEKFAEMLRTSADSVVEHLRPIRLARQLGCSDDIALDLCCRAADAGMLELTWDVICPVCRVTSQNENSIKNIALHSHCDYCNLGFKPDFAQSIELIFKIHPDIRTVDRGQYCIGGPFHAPHVISQNRVTAGTHKEFSTPLASGNYVLKSSGLEDSIQFRTGLEGNEDVLKVDLGQLQQLAEKLRTSTGIYSDVSTCIKLNNATDVDLWSRLETESGRSDAMTAAMASMHPLFAQLFPSEIVRPDQLVEKANRYLLCVQLIDFDSVLQSQGEIAIRENWDVIAQAITGVDDHDKNEFLVGDTSATFIFNSLSQLISAVDLYCHAYPGSANIERHQYALALGFGEVISSDRASHASHFGPAIRDIQKRALQLLSLTHVCEPVLLPRELSEIATLQPFNTIMQEVPGKAVEGHTVFNIRQLD